MPGSRTGATYTGISEAWLVQIAKRILEAWGLRQAVAPAEIVQSHLRLTALLTLRYKVKRMHREWPVSVRLENRRRRAGARPAHSPAATRESL